jgi:hypothetical protein
MPASGYIFGPLRAGAVGFAAGVALRAGLFVVVRVVVAVPFASLAGAGAVGLVLDGRVSPRPAVSRLLGV